jgi:hypothetical protein
MTRKLSSLRFPRIEVVEPQAATFKANLIISGVANAKKHEIERMFSSTSSCMMNDSGTPMALGGRATSFELRCGP